MEAEKGRMKKAAARRRSRTFPVGIKCYPGPSKEGEKKWGFMIAVAGAFLLALVAFISGVWMGKTINDLPASGKPLMQTKKEKQKEEKRDFFAPDEWLREGDRANREGKTSPSEVPDKREEKNRIAPPTKPRGGEEKFAESAPSKIRFTLQVGAFNNSEEAQKLVSQLQSRGYVAYEITGKGAAKGMWYRVRVGNFPSLQDARQFALMFEKKEKIKAVITTESVP
jgi:hypothetical protein